MLTIYKASAGSGKTFTLAYEYIKLLLGRKESEDSTKYVLNHPDRPGEIALPHARILATTFTNKATAEMKSRILKELHALAHVPTDASDDTPYAKMLMDEFGCNRDELAQAAERALRGLLNDYGSFNITTIDSFFHSLLRAFARELDRQGDYRVELNGKIALAQALSLLLDEISRNNKEPANKLIIDWLTNESNERRIDGNDFDPFNKVGGMHHSIIKNMEGIFNETFAAKEDSMRKYMNLDGKQLILFDKWLLDQIKILKAKESNATNMLRSISVDPEMEFDRFPAGLIKKALNSDEMTKTIFTPFISQAKYIVTMKENGGFKSGYSPSEYQKRIVQDWVITMEETFPKRFVYEEIHKRMSGLWAIFYIDEFLDRYRQDNNLMLNSDTNSLLYTIIKESETPFIYERVGNDLENFLIDEFQDTSAMQWDNLKPLVQMSQPLSDSLIIGDVKQSIYRFRGGDPNLLGSRVQNKDFPSEANRTVKGNKPGENTNYRSAANVVKFNNTLFWQIAAKTNVPGFEGVAQALSPKSKKIAGWVKINDLTPLTPKTIATSAANFLPQNIVDELESKNMLNKNEVAMRITALQILDQLERGYRQSDIALLFFKNKEGREMAEFLGREYNGRIRLISSDMLLLSNSPAVKTIISILEIFDRSLDTPRDESLERVVEGSTIFSSKKERERLLRSYHTRRRRAALADAFEYYAAQDMPFDEALFRALEASENIGNNPDIGGDLNNIRLDAPTNLSALVQSIIKHKITPDAQAGQIHYIASFVDIVDEFMQNTIPSVHSFLQYWNDNKAKLAISPSEREDAVTITTIHKAKGLEWPCVHLPFVNWSYEEEPSEQWYYTTDNDNNPLFNGPIAPPMVYLRSSNVFGVPSSPLSQQYNQERDGIRADNICKTYVAFTRASQELHANIISDSEKSIGKVILSIFKKPNPIEGDPELYVDLKRHAVASGLEIGSFTAPEHDIDIATAQRILSRGYNGPAQLKGVVTDISGINPDGSASYTITDENQQASINVKDGFWKKGKTFTDASDFTVGKKIIVEGTLSAATGEMTPGSKVVKCGDDVSSELTATIKTPDFKVSFNSLGKHLTRISEFLYSTVTSDQPDEDEKLQRSDLYDEATRRGVLMHCILSDMQHFDDLELAVQRRTTKLSENERNEYLQALREAFAASNGQAHRWFSDDNPRMLVEQAIYNSTTDKTIRPDRVVWLPDGTVEIVEYKFTSEILPTHYEQARDYGWALQSMGYNTKVYLWYPLHKRIIHVEI